MTLLTRPILCGLALLLLTVKVQSQTSPSKAKLSVFDGIIVGGYVDKGAYLNCTGPGIRFTRKPFTVIAGLLPGLRIKEDKVQEGSPQNSTFTPSLGFGLTTGFKHLVLQIPLYYNSKTTTKDGKWNAGVGIGYRF